MSALRRAWRRFCGALRPGESWFMLLRQLPDWPRQSVLGLPLLCDHFVVFDRQVNELGVVRLARARHPGP